MTRNAFRTLFATSLVAVAAPAFAQPSATEPVPAPATAPQNYAWTDVSHINGQLVPVGESNSYLYQFRRTNISANPIGWIAGFYGISASVALNDHVAIRGELDYINPVGQSDGYRSDTIELDATAPIYLRRTYQGAYLEPGLIYRQTRSTDTIYAYDSGGSTTSERTTTVVGPQVLFGWHWTWDSGFNVSAAFGLGRNLNAKSEGSSDDELIPNGYFRVGYAF